MATEQEIEKIDLNLTKIEHHMVQIKKEIIATDTAFKQIPKGTISTDTEIQKLREKLAKRKQHLLAINQELNKIKPVVDGIQTSFSEHAVKLQTHLKKLEQHITIINNDFRNLNILIKDSSEEVKTFDKSERPENITSENTHIPKTEIPIPSKKQDDIESFIGKNIVSKIGIGLLVLGVGVGVKYAIDNHLIDQGIRIILGYAVGLSLFITSVLLRKKYENYALVLFGGAMSILYFVTYFAFAYYQYMGREVAFGLMILFTIFTVFTAFKYNNQFIAQLGLVGSYAIPFLISAKSANVTHLFIYMSIINSGILIIAIKKYWKSLYYSAFSITWLIFAVWFVDQYNSTTDFTTALLFSAVFFLIFYITLIGYKTTHSKQYNAEDIIFVIFNSILFFAFGIAILDHQSDLVLSTFSIANAGIHLIVNLITRQFTGYDRNFHYFTIGLAIASATVTIPILAETNWIAAFLGIESAILFWIGRKQNISFYEIASYPLMGLSIIALLITWTDYYSFISTQHLLFKNEAFYNSIIIITILAIVRWIGFVYRENKTNAYDQVVTGLWLTIFYLAFFVEINAYWNIKISSIDYGSLWFTETNETIALRAIKFIWLINFTALYLTLISWINIIKFKSKTFSSFNLYANAIHILIFLVAGLYELSYRPELHHFLNYYLMRYFSLGVFSLLIITSWIYVRKEFNNQQIKVATEVSILGIILWLLTSELFNWAQITHLESFYKAGLSLLWGFYGFGLMVIGIAKKTKYLRITAFAFFGITLLKLFFFDLANINTIGKTILLISLGILLLIVSFLYNKYIGKLLDEDK